MLLPFGLEKKINDAASFFANDVPSDDEATEIQKISDSLFSDEQVLVVARQSRIKSGGSPITPAVIFATNRRLIIREPANLGLTETIHDIPYDTITSVSLQKGMLSSSIIVTAAGLNPYGIMSYMGYGRTLRPGEIDAIPKEKAEKIIECIKNGMTAAKKDSIQNYANQHASVVADEIEKLVKLRENGLISDKEFSKMKQKLLRGPDSE